MLVELHRDIDSRTREIVSSHPSWPCRRGCDTCCRRLAQLPSLTQPEWDLIAQGVAQLPQNVRVGIRDRIQFLQPSAEHHICPFLDPDQGSCLIYDYRPVLCRTYGFYVERDGGLYCQQIAERVDSGEFADVVWGNIAAVDARLGEKIGLLEWFNDSPEWSLPLLPIQPSGSPDPCGAR